MKAFILGNPRSGTTLLRLMLNSHPEIIAPPECGFLQWWYKKYGDWSTVDSESVVSISRFVSDLLTSKKIETWGLDKDRLREYVWDNRPENYSELSLLVYNYWGLINGKNPSIIVDKNNYYIHHLSEIDEIWPEAKYIQLIRDGRDIVCSYREVERINTSSPYKPKLPTDINHIANEWVSNNSRIDSFLKHKQNNDSIVLRYEDLLLYTERELEKLTSFLDLKYTSSMLDYHSKNEEPSSTIDWKRKTREKIDLSNIGKYITKLTSSEISAFEKIASSTLEKYGYNKYLV